MLLILFLVNLISGIFCLFDKKIKKPLNGSGLFFRRKNQNEFIISNSKTSFMINIRTGEKKNFSAIIPLNSTIYEPFLGYWDNENWAYIVDTQTKDYFIKIYYLKDNVYHKYHAVNINKQYKRK